MLLIVALQGPAKLIDCVGTVKPPETVIVMSRLMKSVVMVTVLHWFKGRAWLVHTPGPGLDSLAAPMRNATMPREGQVPIPDMAAGSQNHTEGRRDPAPVLSVPVAVRWMMLRQSVPSAVGYKSKLTVYWAGRDTRPTRLPCVSAAPEE